jgi:hypothetical protein
LYWFRVEGVGVVGLGLSRRRAVGWCGRFRWCGRLEALGEAGGAWQFCEQGEEHERSMCPNVGDVDQQQRTQLAPAPHTNLEYKSQ